MTSKGWHVSSRRTFVKGMAAAGVAGAFGITGRAKAGVGDTYPGWNPGDLDLHFIYTCCGENMFYRLPDGTSILNDTGDFYRPKDLEHVPLLPFPERLGGEWVSRYVQRVYPEKTIDYLVLSHWHRDHVGHAKYILHIGRISDFLTVGRDHRYHPNAVSRAGGR